MKFLKKLLKFFYWLWYDFKNPPKKRPYGIYCYIGLPGSGKTLALVERLNNLKLEFPKAKIMTNFGYKKEDEPLLSWRQLVSEKNGEDGIIFGLDEAQGVFDRKDWSKIPKNILTVFAQNRHHAKMFLCTSQAYEDIAIDLRRRCHLIIECINLFGANRWIYERGFRPENWALKDGQFRIRTRAFRYTFVADNEIYNAYDTYQDIEDISESHFEDFSERKNPQSKYASSYSGRKIREYLPEYT